MIEIVNVAALMVGYAVFGLALGMAGLLAWWAVEHRVRDWRDRGGR